jgi:hypothetical protein
VAVVVLGVGLVGVSTALLWSFHAKRAAEHRKPRRTSKVGRDRERLAVVVLFGLWLLSLAMIWVLATAAAATEGQAGSGSAFVSTLPFLVSGPIAYWIGRRLWTLLLPLSLIVVWVIGQLTVLPLD